MKREGDKSLKCSNDPDDRISRLPDDILVHILCSMTIKKQGDATETVEENVAENNDSLLSRRWRYLSASLPRLDFSHTTLLDKSLIYYDECQMIQFCMRVKKWWSREVTVRMNKVPQLVELSMSTCFKAADEISFFSSCLSQLESLKLRVSSLYDREHLGHNVLCLVTKLTKPRELEILFEPDMVKDLFPLVALIEAPPHLHKIVIRLSAPVQPLHFGHTYPWAENLQASCKPISFSPHLPICREVKSSCEQCISHLEPYICI
ncbi:hypothetical protein LINPERHAP1_LOCUS39511 [Linum perenne]